VRSNNDEPEEPEKYSICRKTEAQFMGENLGEPDDFSNLLWAINGTRTLSLKGLSKRDHAILSLINEKIAKLRALGCNGLQEKFKKFDQVGAISYLAELVVAESFLIDGHRATLLSSEYFPKASPDILVQTRNGDFYVEVLYMSSSDPSSVLIDRLREITEKYPYVIKFSFGSDVSLPHHKWNERNRQLKTLESSVAQFASDLEHKKIEDLPYHGKTDSFSYDIIERNSSGKGYPAVLTSSCSIDLDFSHAYLTIRLNKKAEKRRSFPPDKQKTPYFVALVCDELGISAGELGYLLYGSTVGYDCFPRPGVSEEVRMKLKDGKWNKILKELSSRKVWGKIQKVKEKGWDNLLSETYLLPHDYCYVDKPGLFITDELLRDVSAVLFSRCIGDYQLFPNPFSIDEMDYSPFWRDLK